jgi:tRNA nucleotidyltransferase/poly(A) polymerase
VSLNSSFKDLLSALNRCEAKYMVVGGYAVRLYTEPRYTKDLDIWVESTPENAQRVFRALAGVYS